MDTATLALGTVALGGFWLSQREPSSDSTDSPTVDEPAEQQQQEETTNPADTWEPVTDDGEVGVSDNNVVYDDPETGQYNDESGDDSNALFESIGLSGDYAERYDPDTQDGSSAPSGGTISDPGDSQTWGSAGEQENDDLSERSASSDMDDDMKSAFDRLANRDTPDY